MNKKVTLVIATATSILFAVTFYCVVNHQNKLNHRLVLLHGSTLNAYYDGRYQEIKRAAYYYGYGWLDDRSIFVAYQPKESAEAVAEVEIVDLRESRIIKLLRLGGVGESNFDINPDNREILFNDSDGIKLLTINSDHSYRIDLIKKNVSAWGVFWIDSETIGYLEYRNGKEVFIELKIKHGRGTKRCQALTFDIIG